MFSDQAEFGKMLQSPEPLKVSAIIHKAFIEVNEEGTEAAAATGKWSKSLVFFGIHHPVHVPFVHPCLSCLLPILQAWRCVGSALLCRLRNQLSSLPTILSPMSLCIRRICHCFGAQHSFHQVLAAYQDSQILRIANKIFVMDGYQLRQEFDQLLSKQFLSAAQSVDFSKNVQAAATINNWVEQRTNHLIKDLVPADVLNSESRLVLVNAIHFKGTWQHQFAKHLTRPDTFHLDGERTVQVPMMSLKERFRYADLPALDAMALELPYKDSDLSMLIVLPNTKTGLPALEEKLRLTTLSQITQSLYETKVALKLPRFKAEFQVELSEVFQKVSFTLNT